MKPAKTTSVDELQVIGRFEYLRKLLLADHYCVHLDKPLVYWALPTDRRLPLAFMGRKLRDLLSTPFAELAATPGIGSKKIHSFIKLLARAANTDAAELPLDLPVPQGDQPAPGKAPSQNGFDPAAVSEVVWGQWRASVLRHGLGPEALGRFAPSLRHMTRVIWDRPLAAYAGMSLAEIRAEKAHGEKRVRAILEVFHSLHSLLSNVGPQEHLVLRIVPRHIDAVETWVGRTLQQPGIPGEEELFSRFVEPLLAQLRLDAAPQIVSLAENRLGLHAPITSVRQVARNMGLTRARVYQLLNEMNDIMGVRWPDGRHQVYELDAKFRAEAERLKEPPRLEQFRAAAELFYPRTRRGASGPLERAGLAEGPSDGEAESDADDGFADG
jgi:hypothetical protein